MVLGGQAPNGVRGVWRGLLAKNKGANKGGEQGDVEGRGVRHNRALPSAWVPAWVAHSHRRKNHPLFSIIQAAGWPIGPLILCSVLALAFIVERALKLKRARVLSPGLLDEAIGLSREAVPAPETVNHLAQHSALGRVLASGWRAINHNPRCTPQDMRAAMETAGREVTHRMELYLPAIATIASAAPLLGLLGTVIGMIDIFGSQAHTGSLAGGNPEQLARGISTALYNTAFGLIVAIPSLICWRYFRAKVDGYVLELELAAERFARHLEPLCLGGRRSAASSPAGAAR
jgi:biopolymer transport protein ExbB